MGTVVSALGEWIRVKGIGKVVSVRREWCRGFDISNENSCYP